MSSDPLFLFFVSVIMAISIFLFSSSVSNSSVFPHNSPYIPRGYFYFPKSLSVKPSRFVLSFGLLHPVEDFTSSICCTLDGLPTRRRVSLVVGLPP